jgi:hypothetical protein
MGAVFGRSKKSQSRVTEHDKSVLVRYVIFYYCGVMYVCMTAGLMFIYLVYFMLISYKFVLEK